MEGEHPVEDESRALPIAPVFRPALRAIVDAFRRGDFGLAVPIPMVAPVELATARQVEMYIADYGDTLIALPDQTWSTSTSWWMGRHWELMVDLWTVEHGLSDMVLAVHARREGSGYVLDVISVHVP